GGSHGITYVSVCHSLGLELRQLRQVAENRWPAPRHWSAIIALQRAATKRIMSVNLSPGAPAVTPTPRGHGVPVAGRYSKRHTAAECICPVRGRFCSLSSCPNRI